MQQWREGGRIVPQVYKRLASRGDHFALGDRLKNAMDAYNSTVASLEANILMTAHKFKDLGSTSGDDESRSDVMTVAVGFNPRNTSHPHFFFVA